jgi:hypothetical protein
VTTRTQVSASVFWEIMFSLNKGTSKRMHTTRDQ